MKKRLVAAVGVLLATAAMVAPSFASAATQIGNACTGNTSAENVTLISTANAPGNPFPATAPASGVITKWTFTVVPLPPGILTQTLKTFRPTGVANQFQVIAESAPAGIQGGANTFASRIPVQAGDLIGTSGFASGKTVTVYCNTESEGDRAAVILGSPTPGSIVSSAGDGPKIQIPITATIEPDADNDGFGDETQDLCPQSATTQVACPVVVLDAFAVAGKGSATVLVASSTEAPITVGATVALPKGKASSSAKAKLKNVTKNVKPGAIAKFKLKYTGSLKSAIAALPPGKSLTLKITASAKNVAGAVSKDKTKLKLKASG